MVSLVPGCMHFSVGSDLARVFFSFRMGTCTDPWNLFSSEQVMVTILVTLVLLNLYLVLHYNLGSGLTRVFRFTTLVNWAAHSVTDPTNSASSVLVMVTNLFSAVSSDLSLTSTSCFLVLDFNSLFPRLVYLVEHGHDLKLLLLDLLLESA